MNLPSALQSPKREPTIHADYVIDLAKKSADGNHRLFSPEASCLAARQATKCLITHLFLGIRVTFEGKDRSLKSVTRKGRSLLTFPFIWVFESRIWIFEQVPFFAFLCASSMPSSRLPRGSLCTVPFSAKSTKSALFHHIRRTCGGRREPLPSLSREGGSVLRAQKACLRRGPELPGSGGFGDAQRGRATALEIRRYLNKISARCSTASTSTSKFPPSSTRRCCAPTPRKAPPTSATASSRRGKFSTSALRPNARSAATRR